MLQGAGAHLDYYHHGPSSTEQHSVQPTTWIPEEEILQDTIPRVCRWAEWERNNHQHDCGHLRKEEEEEPSTWTADILIVDFAKAFSKVHHSLLIHKLSQYGSQGEISRWISDFLNNRRQAVVVSGARSEFVSVQSGVPQEGIRLGPCLFLIYINDLPDTLTAQTRLFADDTAAYKVVTCPDDQTQLRDLNQLAEWEKWWDTAFDPRKCTSLPVTRSRKPLGHQYELHGQILETVSTTATNMQFSEE